MTSEQPSHALDPGDASVGPQAEVDSPVARQLQILSTEHWSLLATRSLIYTESFSRVNMFFSVLSGAVISLALIAQAGRFGQTFLVAAVLLLSIVIFVGIATIARLMTVNGDDLRWVGGMNRLRHAYLEMHPELEKYFVAGWNDDARGISMTMGLEHLPSPSSLVNLGHGFQTLPGMLSVIVAVVPGALGALVAVCLAAPIGTAVAIGAFAFLLLPAVLT